MPMDRSRVTEVELAMEPCIQWKVTAYTGKNRNVQLGSSYVLAQSESKAIELGKRALRLIGIRGQFRVSAALYDPTKDWEFNGFIRVV
jgi:hypothetical protein